MKRETYPLDVNPNMQPGETVVVPGLGILQLQYRDLDKLVLRAKMIVVIKQSIVCFMPTKKTVTHALAAKHCNVRELVIIDSTGTFVGTCIVTGVTDRDSLLILDTK